MAGSLWPVPADDAATARTEDAGDQERSGAIPIVVEEQAPFSLAARRRVAPCRGDRTQAHTMFAEGVGAPGGLRTVAYSVLVGRTDLVLGWFLRRFVSA